MVLNRDYSGFPSTPQNSLDATTGHELNHSIQFGYGVLIPITEVDDSFVEGGATWMEDEVHDAANDNQFYLWPDFRDSLGEYGGSPYEYWITFRGLTERYGTGSAGGGEQVMQDFWELSSQETQSGQQALNTALGTRGTTLADAFHAYGVAVKFNRTCGGGYALPYCFEEAAGYAARATPAGAPAVHATVASVGGNVTSSVEDNHAVAWVALPSSGSTYDVSLKNNSTTGGQLRGTVACDTGSGFELSALPAVAAANQTRTLTGFDPAGCASRVLVVTNQAQTGANPSTSASRSFTVSTAAAPPTQHLLSVTRAGTGAGTVTSSPGGINCGNDCSQDYSEGTAVALSATPQPGSSFAGWSGACTGIGPCTVTMSTSRSVTATFNLIPDTTAPETNITGGPDGDTSDTTPTFTPADVLAPAVGTFRLSRTVFRAARSGPALAAALVGTRISLRLSEAANVTFRVARLAGGRSVRLRGRIVRSLPAGTSRLRYRGRLAGRALRPGRYRLIMRARDAAGNVSSVRRVAFTIVR